jgi:hypothetical protein
MDIKFSKTLKIKPIKIHIDNTHVIINKPKKKEFKNCILKPNKDELLNTKASV